MTDENNDLNKTKNGEIRLDRNHSYYYQAQLHLFATKKSYCDFYIWTIKDWHWEQIFTRWDISVNKNSKIRDFLQELHLASISWKSFYKSSREWKCFSGCKWSYIIWSSKQPDFSTIIGCDNIQCAIGWFHIDCVKWK